MKRLRPRLFTLVSLISLCLCTLSIYVWRESSKHPTFAYPTTNAMRYTLLGSLPPLNLNDLSLAASLETTARYLPHVKYEIDWPALEAINVTQSMPVGTNLGQIRLGELLAKLTTPIGPKVRFTTHDDVIRISTIDTPLSTHGVQTIQSIPIDPFQDALAFHYQRLNSPPQPEIRPLYERTIGQRRLTFGAYHGYLEVCLSPRDPADIYCKSRPPIPTPGAPANLFPHRILVSTHPLV